MNISLLPHMNHVPIPFHLFYFIIVKEKLYSCYN